MKFAAYVAWASWTWAYHRGQWTEWNFGPWLHQTRNRHGVVTSQRAGLDLGPFGSFTAHRRRKITRTEPM